MVFLSEEGGSPECGHRLVDDAIGGNRRHFDELDACGVGVVDLESKMCKLFHQISIQFRMKCIEDKKSSSTLI